MGIIKVIDIRAVNQFTGAFSFLSNFYLHPIVINDITYRSSEHAYQSAKFVKGTIERTAVMNCITPFQAKREADRIIAKLNKYQPESAEPADKADRIAILTPDWEKKNKLIAMNFVLRVKFAPEVEFPGGIRVQSEMAELLLKTDTAPLFEGNWWHDNYWGSCEPKARATRVKTSPCRLECSKPGENHLGKLLMAIRKDLRSE